MSVISDNDAYASNFESGASGEENARMELPAKPQFAVGTYVTFGRYRQNGKKFKPIEWLVLDNDGDTALLLSKYGLDCQPFNYNVENVYWHDCYLRKWLNRKFLHRAFDKNEQQRIVNSKVFTGYGKKYACSGGLETYDKIFCLSIDEAEQYFECDEDRACVPTAYAVRREVQAASDKDKDSYGNCCFWLRNRGYYCFTATYVEYNGYVVCHGTVLIGSIAVRPALRIKLG